MSLEAPPSVGVTWALLVWVGPHVEVGLSPPTGHGPRAAPSAPRVQIGATGGHRQAVTQSRTVRPGDSHPDRQATRLAQQQAKVGPIFPAP